MIGNIVVLSECGHSVVGKIISENSYQYRVELSDGMKIWVDKDFDGMSIVEAKAA